MKNKKYLFFGVVGIFAAFVWFVNLSGNSSLPDSSTKGKPEYQGANIIEDENKLPVPDMVEKPREDQAPEITEKAGDDPAVKSSKAVADENNDQGGALNEKYIVDKELLRKRFPEKAALIPVTEEEVEGRKRFLKKRYDKLKKILAGSATEEEINSFYDEREMLTKDRMEIVEFTINQFGDKLSEDGLRRYTETLLILQNQLSKIPGKRKKAIAKLKSLEGQNEKS